MKENLVKIDPSPKRENGRFVQGVSGNPLGRPKGSKNKMTIMREKLQDDLIKDGEELLQIAVKMAKEGDRILLKELLDRIIPKQDKGDSNERSSIQITLNNLTTKDGTTVTIEGETIEPDKENA